jgi:hypothetical protein
MPCQRAKAGHLFNILIEGMTFYPGAFGISILAIRSARHPNGGQCQYGEQQRYAQNIPHDMRRRSAAGFFGRHFNMIAVLVHRYSPDRIHPVDYEIAWFFARS